MQIVSYDSNLIKMRIVVHHWQRRFLRFPLMAFRLACLWYQMRACNASHISFFECTVRRPHLLLIRAYRSWIQFQSTSTSRRLDEVWSPRKKKHSYMYISRKRVSLRFAININHQQIQDINFNYVTIYDTIKYTILCDRFVT